MGSGQPPKPVPTPFEHRGTTSNGELTPRSSVVGDDQLLKLSSSPTSKLYVKVPSAARAASWDDDQPSTATRSGRYHRSQPFFIGVAGGTASGKTTVCDCIMQRLHDQCVVMLSQDSFYRGLTEEELQHVQGAVQCSGSKG